MNTELFTLLVTHSLVGFQEKGARRCLSHDNLVKNQTGNLPIAIICGLRLGCWDAAMNEDCSCRTVLSRRINNYDASIIHSQHSTLKVAPKVNHSPLPPPSTALLTTFVGGAGTGSRIARPLTALGCLSRVGVGAERAQLLVRALELLCQPDKLLA